MNLVNTTKFAAAYTMATDKTGRESVVVVAKGTYAIPERPDQPPQLLPEQVPPVGADEFTGAPGFSAPLYECDFAAVKPRCDVLLNGSAYAPGGDPVESVMVGLRVGSFQKSLNVVGNRAWKYGLLGLSSTRPEPFVKMSISYDKAFGGVDNLLADETKHRTFLKNHVGKGFQDKSPSSLLDGRPLPNTEEIGKRITKPNGNFLPMAFGSVGRGWEDRIKWAGTYDKGWLENKFPFLPDDFDTHYFQSASQDQWMDYPAGGEEVELINLNSQGRSIFRLPTDLAMPVLFANRDGKITERPAVVDTILIEPDKNRFMLVWRTSLEIRRTIREVVEMTVGKTIAEVEREKRISGKKHYKSLAELVAASTRPRTPAKTRR